MLSMPPATTTSAWPRRMAFAARKTLLSALPQAWFTAKAVRSTGIPARTADPMLSELNPEQREAVLHGDGPQLVLAGQAGDQPFFLFAHYSDPHDPYNAHGTVEREVELVLDGEPLDRVLASEFGFRSGVARLEPNPGQSAFRLDLGCSRLSPAKLAG